MSEPITFLATAATEGPDREGDRLSFAALRSLQEQINEKPCPLSWAFDPSRIVGKVTRAQVVRRRLEVMGHIDPDALPMEQGHKYVAPAFQTLKADYEIDGSGRTIEELQLMIFGLTRAPIDPNLEPLSVTQADLVAPGWALAELQMVFVEEAERLLEQFITAFTRKN